MSLQDSIERRRAAEPPAVTCAGSPGPCPTLMLSVWQGDEWALPWSHLESARLVGVDGREQLVLSFTKHRVTISGDNLRGLWDDVAAFRVGCLRDLPAPYRAKASAGSPFISRIEVKAHSDESGRT